VVRFRYYYGVTHYKTIKNSKMKKSFEEYLQQKFIDQFTGTKDQAEIAEENWFERLDVSELIEYGDDFAKSSVENALETLIDLMRKES
jgi:hypothetical protein